MLTLRVVPCLRCLEKVKARSGQVPLNASAAEWDDGVVTLHAVRSIDDHIVELYCGARYSVEGLAHPSSLAKGVY